MSAALARGLALTVLAIVLGLVLALKPARAVPSPGGEMCVPAGVLHQSLAAHGVVLPRGAFRARPGTIIEVIRGRQLLTLVVRRGGRVCAGRGAG